MKRNNIFRKALALFFVLIMVMSSNSSTYACDGGTYDFTGLCFDLRPGSSGYNVTRLQSALINLGYLYGSADGYYGPQTADAVKRFQQRNGIHGSYGSEGIATTFTQALLYGWGGYNSNSAFQRATSQYGSHSIYDSRAVHRTGSTGNLSFRFQNDSYAYVVGVRVIYWLEDYYGYHVTNQNCDCWDQYKYGINLGHGDMADFSIDFTPYSYEMSDAGYVRFCVAEIAYSTGEVYVNYDASGLIYTESSYKVEWSQ